MTTLSVDQYVILIKCCEPAIPYEIVNIIMHFIDKIYIAPWLIKIKRLNYNFTKHIGVLWFDGLLADEFVSCDQYFHCYDSEEEKYLQESKSS